MLQLQYKNKASRKKIKITWPLMPTRPSKHNCSANAIYAGIAAVTKKSMALKAHSKATQKPLKGHPTYKIVISGKARNLKHLLKDNLLVTV
jgi:hypothetical protein